MVGPGGDIGRLVLAGVYSLAGLAAVVALLAVAGWWSSIQPSNERDWQPEVARLAHATIQGDLVTVHNIRNFDYRTE